MAESSTIWRTAETDDGAADALAGTCGLPRPLAAVLVSRGLTDPREVDRFLNPRLSDTSDPMSLPGISRAAKRLWEAVDRGERVTVFGDYDVDGVTATALVVRVLGLLGADVTACLPHREREGYGLSPAALERCLKDCNPGVLLTVDCGTNDVETVARAESSGVTVIVTDHHEVSSSPSQPFALVNPKLGADEDAASLSGAGVAFKLCHALVKTGRQENRSAAAEIDLRNYLELVALGTVADVVPLLGENRALVRYGLGRAACTSVAGLSALIECAGISGGVGGYEAAFMLGPRLNAAGRLGNAERALELLLTADADKARRIASDLDADNRKRQAIEKKLNADAARSIDEHYNPSRDYGIVVSGEGWHPGVIGIVASRMCRRYGRPVAVITFSPDGHGRGSCRSIPPLDLIAALDACSEYLDDYGGHHAAAGVSLRRETIDAFSERFNDTCRELLAGIDLRRVQEIDAWLDPGEVDDRLHRALQLLRPYGEGNHAPVWGMRNARLVGKPRILQEQHLKMQVACGATQLDAIAFGMAHRPVPADGMLDLAFTLEENNFGGRRSLQIKVRNFRASRQDNQSG